MLTIRISTPLRALALGTALAMTVAATAHAKGDDAAAAVAIGRLRQLLGRAGQLLRSWRRLGRPRRRLGAGRGRGKAGDAEDGADQANSGKATTVHASNLDAAPPVA